MMIRTLVTPLMAAALFTLPFTAFVKTAQASVSSGATAKSGMDIAAVVGGDAISSYDLENRIKFIIVTAKLSNTPDVVARIRPQVIRSLIDEKLELQEASKNDVVISDDDVKKAIAGIEQDRGMPSGEIERMLTAHNIPQETFMQQIRAQLAWRKLLIKKIRPQVHVSDEEVQLASARMALPEPKQKIAELQIAVITLPVDKPAHEAEMRKLADKLVQQVRAGASFEEVSRQFSSRAAPAGGRLEAFWVKPQQLDPSIAKALLIGKVGMVTDPIRNADGFTIVKVYNARQVADQAASDSDAKPMEVNLKEILLKLKPDASDQEADTMVKVGEDIAKHPGNCTDKTVANITNPDKYDIVVDFKHSLLSELSPALKALVDTMKVGDISTPFASDEGIRLYMLCDRKESAGKIIDRERVYQMLLQHKMELESEKYLRNLRREVYIEVR